MEAHSDIHEMARSAISELVPETSKETYDYYFGLFFRVYC